MAMNRQQRGIFKAIDDDDFVALGFSRDLKTFNKLVKLIAAQCGLPKPPTVGEGVARAAGVNIANYGGGSICWAFWNGDGSFFDTVQNGGVVSSKSFMKISLERCGDLAHMIVEYADRRTEAWTLKPSGLPPAIAKRLKKRLEVARLAGALS